MIDGVFTRPPQQAIPPPIKPSRQAQPSISAAQAQPNIQYPSSISEFDSIISSWKMAIAFFTSETCGPCKMIEPYFHSLSKSYTNMLFIHVDTQKQFAVARAHQI